MKSGILAAGNWIVDYVNTIDVYPEQDALANILSVTTSNGGAPFNVLVDLAKLEAPFALFAAGLVGEDPDGRRILAQCQDLGIDTEQLRSTSQAPTATTQVMSVQATGRRTFFCSSGANALLSPAHFDFAKSTAKLFHLGYLLLLAGLDRPDESGTGACSVLKSAKTAGMVTSIDVVSEDSNRFAEVVRPALPFTDICFLNEFEAERTTAVQLRSESGVLKDRLDLAAQALLDLGVNQIAVIHFAEGAFALSSSGERVQQGAVLLPRELVVSAVGSGDAFAAGFLYAYHEGQALDECLRYGVCSAAACVMEGTTSGGVRRLETCLALGDRFGFRT